MNSIRKQCIELPREDAGWRTKQLSLRGIQRAIEDLNDDIREKKWL